MKKILYIIVLILALGLGFWYWKFNRPEIIAVDTVVKGDYEVERGKRISLEKGVLLTVEGDLDLDGEIYCSDSSQLRLIVTGNANISGRLKCESGENSGIQMVVNGSVTFAEDSEISSNGDIQLAENTNLLAQTTDQLDKLYEDSGAKNASGKSIGPLIETGQAAFETDSGITASPQPKGNWFRGLLGTKKAKADSHTVVIGGRINVATPPPGVKRIVVFNFPTAAGVEIRDLELKGPDGRPGDDDKNASCSARGKDGEDAFRFLAYAGNMTVNNFTLKLGSGGKGGDAETTRDCDPGIATGGAGGKSGNFKMVGGNEFKIIGVFIIEPGKGGDAGKATAYGKDGGPSQKGGDATANGGQGAANKKELSIVGTIAGTENVQIGSMIGGKGGDATAIGGKGGDGIGCRSNGGPGGNATAVGGNGGDAQVSLAGGAGRTAGAQDNGGEGGSSDAKAGRGGEGGDCGPEDAGGPGGKGGDATSKPGSGGIGTTKNGDDGEKKNEVGGDGGNGGDGCPEGAGGNGGKGNPPGKDGSPGKNLCPKDSKTSTQPDDPSGIDPEPDPTPTPSGTKVQVILYNGKYISISNQLHKETGHESDPTRSCPQEHWHSFEGIVITTDKTQITEPVDPCGFGTTSAHPAMEISL
ncbi:MAG: hypothetical protein Q8R08_04315 [bacterium]|nr:hypothetical protein [bacterium]